MSTTLREYLTDHAPLPPDRALALFRALAAACAASGGRSIGRRLRPEAIEVDAGGNPSLGTRSATSPFDDRYLAGDIHRGGPPDERADLFALGVILFEALTGRRPDLWETPGEVRPGVSALADELYRRCTSPLPRRFRSWAEALEFLDRAGSPQAAPAAAFPASASGSDPSGRSGPWVTSDSGVGEREPAALPVFGIFLLATAAGFGLALFWLAAMA